MNLNNLEFDFLIDGQAALLWQHNDATRLQSLVTQKDSWTLQVHTNFWNAWFANIFNLKTANQFGLIVWAIILNVPIEIFRPNPANYRPSWGFGTSRGNFDNSNFLTYGIRPVTLTLEEQRQLLRMRYYALTLNQNVMAINDALVDVFGSVGVAYLKDNQDMSQEYVFKYAMSNEMKIALTTYDILPRPAGVKSIITISP